MNRKTTYLGLGRRHWSVVLPPRRRAATAAAARSPRAVSTELRRRLCVPHEASRLGAAAPGGRRGGEGRTTCPAETTSRSTSRRAIRKPTALRSIGLTSSAACLTAGSSRWLKVYIAPLDEVEEMCFSRRGAWLLRRPDARHRRRLDGRLPARIDRGPRVRPSRRSEQQQRALVGDRLGHEALGKSVGSLRTGRARTGISWRRRRELLVSIRARRFAESYRVLVETNGTAVGYDWPIVDPSFRPTHRALSRRSAMTSCIPGSRGRRERSTESFFAEVAPGPRRSRRPSTGSSVSG